MDGHYITIYLSPRTTTESTPADGKITRYRYIPGRLFPVNRLGVGNIDGLFSVNERLTTHIESPLGQFAVVKVGAIVMIATYHPIRTNTGQHRLRPKAPTYKRSSREQIGRFHLGPPSCWSPAARTSFHCHTSSRSSRCDLASLRNRRRRRLTTSSPPGTVTTSSSDAFAPEKTSGRRLFALRSSATAVGRFWLDSDVACSGP